jgi:RNA polymerase sigma-70 factor (ECF subfamily)
MHIERRTTRPPDLDRAAFRLVFEEHRPYVQRTLRRLGVQAADLEDLTHEVFVTFHRRRGCYDPGRPLRPWLCGIALRVATAHRRLARQSAEVLGWEVDDVLDSAPLPDQSLASHQDLALAKEALDALALNRRVVFVMHEIDGAGMPDIARLLEIPLNTAYSRLRLAREDFMVAAQRLRASRR